jgi:hypothetical protein
MTLEHIPEAGDFMSMLRKSIGERPEAIVYCQVPECSRILQQGMFCDVPYEHCSYFTKETLAFALRRAGFEIEGSEVTYGGQHLAVFARPGKLARARPDLADLRQLVLRFAGRCSQQARQWIECLERAASKGERVVLWGSGSKSTSFLSSLGIRESIEHVVDINPYRHGMFMAGTGQEIISPEDLVVNPPDQVIIMNPIYRDEIRRTLEKLGLAPDLHDLGSL